ncbi:MAG: hypothetical protein PHS19_07005, partial [Eubacteriales bacterium]|nr:hypothetical protein [Eubacteriales bacterium]
MKIRRKNKIISMIMVYVMLFTVFNLSGWNIITANAAEGIDLTNVTTETTYPAGGGSVNFNPKKLTLSNAVINTSDQYALNLGANVTEIVLEGINSVTNTFIAGGVGILASNDDGPLIIRGDSSDSLDVSARYGICAKALTFSGGNVTIEGSIYGLHAKGNVLVQNGAQVSVKSEAGFPIYVEGNSNELFDLTVDGNSKLTIEGYAPVDGNMAVSNGSIVTVAGSADIYGNLTVSGGSSLTLDEVCY